jgi:hypothetical protein
MTPAKPTHDLNNALLFLETFPEILQDSLPPGTVDSNEALREVLEVYQEKIALVKRLVNKV